LISFHNLSGIFLIAGRYLIRLHGTSIESSFRAICLSIFGIGSKSNPEQSSIKHGTSVETKSLPSK
jgi:hypothetical protein